MKHVSVLRRSFVATALIALATAFFIFASMLFSVLPASASETSTSLWSQDVAVENANFTQTSGSAPAIPTSWTGTKGDGYYYSVKSGIVNENTYGSLTKTEKEKYGLSVAPVASPASKSEKSFLFINAGENETVYKYTSSTFALEASSYYKITAWVKTENVSNASGAAVLIKDLDSEPVGFTAINTNGEWKEYTIYVETSGTKDSMAALSLQLGSETVGGESAGVAYFDNVSVTELSSYNYYQVYGSTSPADNVMTLSYYDYNNLLNEGADFNDVTAFGTPVGAGTSDVIEAGNGISGKYGVETIVRPPVEKTATNKILALATAYDETEKTYESGFVGYKSKDFTVNRFAYYRLSGWYYGVGETSPVSVTVNTKSAYSNGNYTANEVTALTIDSANENHNGWNEFVVLIKGSDRVDFTANVVLGVGTATTPAAGVAFYDDIRLIQITPTQYTSFTSSANKSIEVDPSTSTGVSNGWMNSVGVYEELEDITLGKPLMPADWVRYTAEGITSDGYSKATVNSENVVGGIVKIDGNQRLLANKGLAEVDFANALLLSSTTPTAVCYESADITITANSYNKLTVSLAVDDITGYGANLVLKKGTAVVSTIEKITADGHYSFYIKGDDADTALTIELWLGLNDRIQNQSKLASGSIYFTNVALDNASTEAVFNEKANTYKDVRINGFGNTYAVVNLGNEDFTLFGSYDTSSVKFPYTWSVTKGAGTVNYGIYDTKNNTGSDIVPSFFESDERYVLVLNNAEATYSSLKLNNAYSFAADSYYKLSFTVKVDIPEDYRNNDKAVGAYVSIGGDYRFDFKNTSVTTDSVTDDQVFQTYTYYIKTGSDASTSNIVIGLGDNAKKSNYTKGTLYVSKISFTTITEIDYSEANDGSLDEYTMIANYAGTSSDTNTDTPDTIAPSTPSSSELWWLVPSILLGVAIVLALVGTFIRKLIEKKQENKKKNPVYENRSSYDRRNVKPEETTEVDATEVKPEETTETETAETVEETTEETTEETAETATEEVSEETATEETAEETANEEVNETTEDADNKNE